MRSRWWGVALTLATLAAIGYAAWSAPTAQAPAADATTASESTASPTPSETAAEVVAEPAEPAFDLTTHSRRDAGSIWVLVDKQRALRPATYEPDWAIVEGYRVDDRVVAGLERLLAAARADGMDLRIMSAYRSYSHQAALYDDRVAAIGADAAARVTAPPGHSEHQTGLAVDFGRATTGECNVEPCFARTPEGRWLRQHAAEFGFILRYPVGAESITGYDPESWHYRFVGRGLATYMREAGIRTLEEVFAGG